MSFSNINKGSFGPCGAVRGEGFRELKRWSDSGFRGGERISAALAAVENPPEKKKKVLTGTFVGIEYPLRLLYFLKADQRMKGVLSK